MTTAHTTTTLPRGLLDQHRCHMTIHMRTSTPICRLRRLNRPSHRLHHIAKIPCMIPKVSQPEVADGVEAAVVLSAVRVATIEPMRVGAEGEDATVNVSGAKEDAVEEITIGGVQMGQAGRAGLR